MFLVPPCESNTKVPNFDGNNTSSCSNKGVVQVRHQKSQAVTLVNVPLVQATQKYGINTVPTPTVA